ncbi:MAG: element excision factor XisI family protein [Planctomycetaceae bacterium]
MDPHATCRDVVKNVILRYARLRPSHGKIRLDPLFDEAHDRYALIQVGWDRGRRVRGLLLYVTLQNGTVCLEYDGMEQGITDELIAGGIPEDQISLVYLSEVTV